MSRAEAGASPSRPVQQPADGDWTAAVLGGDRAAGRGADGARFDLLGALVGWRRVDMARIAAALQRAGAALLVDATHDVGVHRDRRAALDPDFLVFPTYKWLLGPYGRAFLYVAKRHQDGMPLEQTELGARAVRAERHDLFRATRAIVDGARRFDMGERDHFISHGDGLDRHGDDGGMGHEAVVARLPMLTAGWPTACGNRRRRAEPRCARRTS